MKYFFSEHRGFWTPARKRSLYVGILLLVISIIVQVRLGHYSSNRSIGAPYVNDLFLDNLPLVNLDFIIVGGDIAVWVLACLLMARHPRYLNFGIKAIALFNIVRALFLTLTHIGPYPTEFLPGPNNFGFGFYRLFTFQGNYFFSGHTGIPFLLALIFWDKKLWRDLFLVLTPVFGATVLLAHVHYSIDVFAAPFIVYGIYMITRKVFPEDCELIA